MKKMKYLRTWLVAALLVTIIGSLTGGTIAWFTDEVTSTSNIIQSGTLDVELYYWDDENKSWEDASSGTIFDYKNWEPGYTQVRYVKVVNAGSLAFDYAMQVKTETPWLNLNADESAGESVIVMDDIQLADVIDVYAVPAAVDASGELVTYASLAEIKAKTTQDVKTITELAHVADGLGTATLLPEESALYCVALHMQEEAGNEYQGLSVGKGFAFQLQAKQAMHEIYDFNSNEYDKDAEYGNVPAGIVIPFTEEEIATVNDENGLDLDVAYTFRTAEDLPTDATMAELEAIAGNHPFANYHADFVVTFDKPVAADSMELAGAYGAWEDGIWLSFPVPQIEAGTEYRLLGEGGKPYNGGKPIYMPYAGIVGLVQEFTCGVNNISDANVGTTMTVELRLYEVLPRTPENNSDNTESGIYVTVGSFEYVIE